MYYKYLIKTLMLIAIFSTASPISARVKYVHINDDGVTIPTIEVFQTELPDGSLRYTTLKAGNYLSPGVNLGVKVEAKCYWGYRLGAVDLMNSNSTNTDSCRPDQGKSCEIVPIPSYMTTDQTITQQINFSDGSRTLGSRIETFNIPTDYFEPLIDYGNEQVAARSDNIIQENNIRGKDWTAYLDVGVNFHVRCSRRIGYTGLDKWDGYDGLYKKIRVYYRAKSAELDLTNPAPGDSSPFNPYIPIPNGQIGDTVNVQASLLDVTNDNADECQLNLSGTFTTNGETNIHYHLVDQTGGMSELFRVPVDQTNVAFVFHQIDLSQQIPDDPDPGSSVDLGFSTVPDDQLKGSYHIEVVSPHTTTSEIVYYNIHPCKTRPAIIKTIVGN